MSTIEDGGPAFPHTDMMQPLEHAAIAGMSLRDWFAGQALAGIYANPEAIANSPRESAEDAYEAADAMLAARKTKP